jgi:hypothetical protein
MKKEQSTVYVPANYPIGLIMRANKRVRNEQQLEYWKYAFEII